MGGENLPTQFQPAADFSAVIIGSGSPQYNPQRSGPSAAIQYRGRFFLVDMGNGTQARLYEAGISMTQIDALMLTHHHRDHDEEFMPLLATALVRGAPLQIIGTPGTKKLADFTSEFYAEDIAYRMERMGRSAANLRKPDVREIQGGESFKLGDVQVKTAQVPHSIHTVAYRFDAGGQSIVISGDLTYSDKLIELARGADVLVIDSGASIVRPGVSRPAGGATAAGEGRQPAAAHASAQDVANMAQKAGVKTLVLTHIAATDVDEEATIKAIHEVYKGTVLVGHDLLQVAPPGAAAPAASATTPTRQPATRSALRFIQRLDKDGDGKVSRTEFDGPAERFGDFDKNGDGFITEDEAPTGPVGRTGARGGSGQGAP
jgi:ribonuclease BN (tRNA processing enzyme)